MNKNLNYQGTAIIWILVGHVFSIAVLWVGWFAIVGMSVCFLVALMCHVSHVGQQILDETDDLKAKLKDMDKRLGPDENSSEI